VTYQPITGWFKNSGKDIYKLIFETSGRVYASGGHLIYTSNGYKKVSDLATGDIIFRLSEKLTYAQEQLLYGSMLGDSSCMKNKQIGKIICNGTKLRFKYAQGDKQKKYLFLKRKILDSFVKTEPKSTTNKTFLKYGCNKNITTWRFATLTSRSFHNIYNNILKNNKKSINKLWLDKIDWMGMAFWYMDDGSQQTYKTKDGSSTCVMFHTQGFSFEENKILKDWLRSKGIESSIRRSKNKKGKIFYFIALSVTGSEFFLRKISKYVIPCMRYKLGKYSSPNDFDKSLYINYEQEYCVVPEKLVNKKFLRHVNVTYDIEVERNNNYFAGNTLVHNCHSLTGAAAEASLKMIEEPPPNVRFILATTEPQSLKDTILSRCITLTFEKIDWHELYQNLLIKIIKQENISIDDEAAKFIAKRARGSARDALQNLQSVADFAGGEKISLDMAEKALGAADESLHYQLIQCLADSKINLFLAVKTIDELIIKGKNSDEILTGLEYYLRTLLLAGCCKEYLSNTGYTEEEIKRYENQAGLVRVANINKMIGLLIDVRRAILVNSDIQVQLLKFIIDSIMLIVGSRNKK
jgi:DNA polymerase III delta subunit